MLQCDALWTLGDRGCYSLMLYGHWKIEDAAV